MESSFTNHNLNCQICTNQYDDQVHIPIIVPCGHTFCKDCIKKMITANSIKKCPICKKACLTLNINELVPNYELISLITVAKRKIENSCESHPSENLNFFCSTCKALICQMCLLLSHIGHEIKRPEDSELSKSLQTFALYTNLSREIKEQTLREDGDIAEKFRQIDDACGLIVNKLKFLSNISKIEQYMTFKKIQNLSGELDSLSSSIKNEYTSIIKKGSKLKINEETSTKIDNIKENFENIKLVMSNECEVGHFQNIEKSIEDCLTTIISANSELEQIFQENYSSQSSKYLCYSDAHNFADYFINFRLDVIFYDYSKSSKDHLRLVDLASLRVECENDYAINIMRSIDRIDFVPNSSVHTYSDSPLMIGWNTTISAPHMHLLTINYLTRILQGDKESIKNLYDQEGSSSIGKSTFPSFKALDIGSGSGYMTLALSKMLGPNSTVFGIDHIEEIIQYSKNNINKHHKYYLESNRIRFIAKDGKDGLPEEQKFHIIHVGAAVQELPQVLIDQLEIGGYMWIPVGPRNSFKKLFLIHKEKSEEITKTELLTCSYAEMTTKEEQLSHLDDNLDNDISLEESF